MAVDESAVPGGPDDAAPERADEVDDELAGGPGEPDDATAALLDRASQAAREEQRDFTEVSESVMTKVRTLVTPSDPVLTRTATGDAERDDRGSRTWVSSRVLRTALRRALQRPTYAPQDIDLTLDADRLERVEVELVCTYGPDLRELADVVRGRVHDELVALLGPDPAFGPAQVDIDVVDIVLGDPTVV